MGLERTVRELFIEEEEMVTKQITTKPPARCSTTLSLPPHSKLRSLRPHKQDGDTTTVTFSSPLKQQKTPQRKINS